MCLIVSQNKGDSIFSPKNIALAWESNSDGAGYMFCRGQSLVIRKPFFLREEFEASYKVDFVAYGSRSPFVLHFRVATHGLCDHAGTHPHIISEDLAMAHNGVLPLLPPTRTESDTAFFCRTVLVFRTPKDILSKPYQRFLTDFIGKNNKLVFLDKYRHVTIINKPMGAQHSKTRWYSNTYWLWSREFLFPCIAKKKEKVHTSFRDYWDDALASERKELSEIRRIR